MGKSPDSRAQSGGLRTGIGMWLQNCSVVASVVFTKSIPSGVDFLLARGYMDGLTAEDERRFCYITIINRQNSGMVTMEPTVERKTRETANFSSLPYWLASMDVVSAAGMAARTTDTSITS